MADGDGYSDGAYNGSIKTVYRYGLTEWIMNTIVALGNLYSHIKFHGLDSEAMDRYELFINSFYIVYQMTADFVIDKEENSQLVQDLAFLFSVDVKTDAQGFAEDLNNIMLAFEDYKQLLTATGFYDPRVFQTWNNPETAYMRM